MLRYVLCVLPFVLSGCATAVITGVAEGGKAIADERSLGRQVDDTGIYTRVNQRFFKSENEDISLNVTVNVRHKRVMLTGNVDRPDSAARAAEMAWEVEGVREVINEINTGLDKSFWNNANDALIKKNLEARLLITKEVSVVSYSIDVVNSTAYLLGAVQDRAEMERVLNVTRATRGVGRVINHLKLREEIEAP